MRTNPDLDPAAIERLRGLGGEKFVREMIGLFLDYVGQKVKEARQAMLAGDLPTPGGPNRFFAAGRK